MEEILDREKYIEMLISGKHSWCCQGGCDCECSPYKPLLKFWNNVISPERNKLFALIKSGKTFEEIEDQIDYYISPVKCFKFPLSVTKKDGTVFISKINSFDEPFLIQNDGDASILNEVFHRIHHPTRRSGANWGPYKCKYCFNTIYNLFYNNIRIVGASYACLCGKKADTCICSDI